MLHVYRCTQCHHPCILAMENYTELDGPEANPPEICPIGGSAAKWEKL